MDTPDQSADAAAPDQSADASGIDLSAYDLGPDVSAIGEDIDALRAEIDRLDAIILAAVTRRSNVSKQVGRTRMAAGGPRLVYSREVKVLERFSSLGSEGHTLAMLLLRLGRGPLGR